MKKRRRIHGLVLMIAMLACDDSTPDTSSTDFMISDELDQAPNTEATDFMMDQPDMTMDLDLDLDSEIINDAIMDMTILPDAEPISLSLTVDQPSQDMVFDQNMPISVLGHIELTSGSLEFVVIEAVLDEQESLPVQVDRSRGIWSTNIASASPGPHTLLVTAAMAPDYRTEITLNFTITCETLNSFSEPLDPNLWVAKGPAIRDERGWVELTQNQLNTKGALFWAGQPVQAGDLDLAFSFSTSKCEEPGECNRNRINAGGGFSINFWDIRSSALESLWSVTRGLGHTTPVALLDELELERTESFHIVFDTYSNTCAPCGQNAPFDGCGNHHEEPTHQNHVAIYRNGHSALHGDPDETGSYCHLGPISDDYADRWSAYPELDNGEWHEAHLIIEGTRVTLTINDTPLLSVDLPDLRFKGGILSLSAGSGVNGNFHRIDNLQVNSQCQ
jgi:hypothetical protein